LRCDAKCLHQILANLLDNAVKYTEQGTITLRAGFAEGNLTLDVTDTGIGIPAEEIPHIFKPFHQIDHAGRRSRGTGLGLSIVKGLMERMGGSISVRSAPGKGTAFRARAPAQPVSIPDRDGGMEQPASDVVGYRRTEGQGPLRILVADDERENREILRGLLERLGFAVQEAEDGSRCIEKAANWVPDLICMDLRMPLMDGLEATRALHEIPRLRNTPIMAVTAAAFGEDHAEALRAGCDAHLAKPVLRDALIRTLGTLLPLEWKHVQMQAEGETTPEVQALPPDRRERLVKLIGTGSVTAIAILAQELARDECCPMLARQIASLADAFDLAGLGRLAKVLGAAEGPERAKPRSMGM
jgi:CheY-like chemotaxis protein/anti-sigma regulatory factor (Ser/Thr protein kinase)